LLVWGDDVSAEPALDELFNYDHRSSKAIVSPFDLWKQMRRECPVSHSDAYGGFWFTTRYDDVKSVLADWQNFSSAQGATIPNMPFRFLPQHMDPPLHRSYRALLNPPLSPREVRRFEGWMRELARKYVRELDVDGFDVCQDYVYQYAQRVALRVIGFDAGDIERLYHWTEVLAISDRQDESSLRASAELGQFLSDILVQRAAEERRDDLISLLVDAEIDGAPLTAEQAQSVLALLTFGGLHTTSTALATALVWLADHPEDRARLERDPSLYDTAIDEFVRFSSPVAHIARTMTADVEFEGRELKEGDKVLIGILSADRDETEFADPDIAQLDRSPNRHVGFGVGPHRCVGAHLARQTIQIGIEEFLQAMAKFSITDHHAIRFTGGEGRDLVNAPMKGTRR
jgi:cytochrome P450